MKMYLTLCLISFGLIANSVLAVPVNDSLDISAEGRLRYELSDNRDFSATRDQYSFLLGRFRLGFDFKPLNQTRIFVQPQYSGTFGLQQVVNTGTTSVSDSNATVQTVPTATTQGRSGGLSDNALDVHQAFVQQQFGDAFGVRLGRQELDYGDHLLIGTVGWSNIGRSFDALKSTISFDWMESDIFYSKIIDRNTSVAGDGDSDFFGIYNKFRNFDFVDELDLYYLYWRDPSSTPNLLSWHSLGGRVKSQVSGLEKVDFRLELTGQFGDVAGASQKGLQVDGEVGFDFRKTKMNRVAMHGLYASQNFNQLFPTAHKWLGHLDLFGRRNIMAIAVHFANWFNDEVGLYVDIHQFWRAKKSSPAYSLNGSSAYGNGAVSSRNLGAEIDLVGVYKFSSNFEMSGGASYFLTGAYLKNSIGNRKPLKGFVQVTASY